MRKLTGDQVRALRKQATCPDCNSTVTVDRRTRVVDVHHSDGCPMARRLGRAGLRVALVYGNADPYRGLPA